jgi:hypothetical protein
MRALKESFPCVDEKRRGYVKAEIVLRILSIFAPRRDSKLRFENLIGRWN